MIFRVFVRLTVTETIRDSELLDDRLIISCDLLQHEDIQTFKQTWLFLSGAWTHGGIYSNVSFGIKQMIRLTFDRLGKECCSRRRSTFYNSPTFRSEGP